MTDNVPWNYLEQFRAIVTSIEKLNKQFPRQSLHAIRQANYKNENVLFYTSDATLYELVWFDKLELFEGWFDEDQQTELPEYFYNTLVDELLAIECAMNRATTGSVVSLDFRRTCQRISATSQNMRTSSPLCEYQGFEWFMADVRATLCDEE